MARDLTAAALLTIILSAGSPLITAIAALGITNLPGSASAQYGFHT